MQVSTGSISAISWSSDSTQLAGAGANGALVFGQVLERRVEWQNIEVVLRETNKIIVHDILGEMEEELEFRFPHAPLLTPNRLRPTAYVPPLTPHHLRPTAISGSLTPRRAPRLA